MNSSFLFLLVSAGIYAVGATMTLAALRRAPEGYEDEEGFHPEPGKL